MTSTVAVTPHQEMWAAWTGQSRTRETTRASSTGEEAGHSAQVEGFWSPSKCGSGIFHTCKEVPIWIKEYSMRNAQLDEAQAGIKISGRDSNNLTYAGNTIVMAKSKEELKSLLTKVKEESKELCLKLNIKKTKIMLSGPITSWQIDGKTMETVTDCFLGFQNHCRWWVQPLI